MKKKKVGKKPATIGTPEEQRSKKETLMHYNAILMENIDSKFKLILEHVGSMSERLTAVEQAVRPIPEILERLSTVEQVVRSNSERLSSVELGNRGLRDDMLDMEHRLSSKINRISERCKNYECRLASLEASQ